MNNGSKGFNSNKIHTTSVLHDEYCRQIYKIIESAAPNRQQQINRLNIKLLYHHIDVNRKMTEAAIRQAKKTIKNLLSQDNV